jgi:hypothetical protein
MNKIKIQTFTMGILLCALSDVSSSAPRKWTQMSKAPQSAVYADVDNIIRSGSIIRYWILLDNRSGEQPKSIVMRNEVNCEVMDWRRVYAAFYDEQMGKGKSQTLETTDAKWKPAIPEDTVVLAYPLCEAFKELDNESGRIPARKQ